MPLTACGGEAAPQDRLDTSQRSVTTMTEAERNPILARAIRETHRRCDTVRSSRALEPAGPVPTYVATCDNGDRFALFVRRGGRIDAQLTGSDPR